MAKYKSLHNLIKIREKQVEDKQRIYTEKSTELDTLYRIIQEIDSSIISEKQVAAANPMGGGLSFSKFIEQTLSTKDEVQKKIYEKQEEVEKAHLEVIDAFKEKKVVEVAEEKRKTEYEKKMAKIEQNSLDEISLNLYRSQQSERGKWE